MKNETKQSIIIIILTILLLILGYGQIGKVSGVKFDSERWKKADLDLEENWTLRWDMMNSLRNNYKLIGMSKSDVIKLLGEPVETSRGIGYSPGDSGHGINTAFLTLTLNDEGIVTEIIVSES